ncbi:MAG: hypothetical protein ACRET2_09330 [Steroidobacteraceae bacterium]
MWDDALQIRGREIWTFVQAVQWLKSLLPEERDAAIAEMEAEAEAMNDVDEDWLYTPGGTPYWPEDL